MRLGLGVLAVLLGLAGAAVGAPKDLPRDPVPGKVVDVVDGDTVLLGDRREVRMVGIQAPKLPLGRRNFKKWPLADEAKSALVKILIGRQVALAYGGRRQDRHGRILAHIQRLDDGLWAQGEMLRLGLARVYTFADNRALTAEMLALEREARTRRRGIWRHPYYRILAPEEAGRYIGEFKLIEGRIVRAAKVKGRVYLNFGEDWSTDFTVHIGRDGVRRFDAAAGRSLRWSTLSGKKVRVRGWLKSFNGAMIDVSHPGQIESLEPTS